MEQQLESPLEDWEAAPPQPAPRSIPFPHELLPVRQSVQAYVNAKIRQFGLAFAQVLGATLDGAQMEDAINKTIASVGSKEVSSDRALRLVLRHDCLSTGCGEANCLLCQFNPSRLCKRNLKNKYLIDDHIKAKCNAPLRVELVDEAGACVLEGLPPGQQLEVHVLNGEKYKEICPDNVLLSHQQLRACIISHHTKALLRREGGSDDQLRCFLQLETGTTALSDLQVTTSSEALLSGKAPTFRLLVWAVDEHGDPMSNVTYVVSENFVVATKRVKHAIKSDIPSVTDSVSKLVHIGKATIDKLNNLRKAAMDEGFAIQICDELNRLEKVGQFQQLVELSELNPDLKHKVRHLLKLSPEKWEEVAQHAQGAVMPDFRPRAWWCPALRAGLLFGTKNGSVCMDQPIALVKMGATPEDADEVVPVTQLDPNTQAVVPRLKAGAVQSWYSPQHPGWSIYYKEGTGATQDPIINASIIHQQQAAGQTPNLALAGPSSMQVASNLASLSNAALAQTVGGDGGSSVGGLAGIAEPLTGVTGIIGSQGGADEDVHARIQALSAPTLQVGARQSGRKRKPTQLPGSSSPPRPSHGRQPSPPMLLLPPMSACLPPAYHVQQGGPALGTLQLPGSSQAGYGAADAAGAGAGQQAAVQAPPDASPFARPLVMGNLADHFPCWQQQQQHQQRQHHHHAPPPSHTKQDTLTLRIQQGASGSANGTGHLLSLNTGGANGLPGQPPASNPPGVSMGSDALLLANNNPLANPLMSQLPFNETIGGSFNMPSFTLPGSACMNGGQVMGLQALQGSGSLHLNGNGAQPPSLNGSLQLGSPALGQMGGGLQANGGLGSGSLHLNTTLLPQHDSIDNGCLPSITKVARTEPMFTAGMQQGQQQ